MWVSDTVCSFHWAWKRRVPEKVESRDSPTRERRRSHTGLPRTVRVTRDCDGHRRDTRWQLRRPLGRRWSLCQLGLPADQTSRHTISCEARSNACGARALRLVASGHS
jgi:hypothetical protein